MAQPWVLRDIARRKKVAGLMQQVMRAHGLAFPDFHDEIHARDAMVTEVTNQRAGLSRAILDHMFPREPSPSTLYHYTDLKGLAGIASSKELRLYPIRKRLGQGGELSAFAQAHGLKGYLDTSQGSPYYEELSDDLFYVSLTRIPPKDPFLMWSAFAQGTGVRLEFEVRPKVAQLRPVYYQATSATTLLAEINAALAASGEPPFVPFTISQIGAFYLTSLVSSEDEVRLMVKRHHGGTDLTRNDGSYDYWPVPLGKANDVCDLDLKGIHVAPAGSVSSVTAAIAGTSFSTLAPTGP